MKLLEFKDRLDSIRNLPTLPLVIENLGTALRDPDVNASRIAEIIEDDPAIMARIMKVVNSSYYLGTQQTTTLREAIVRIGFQAVSNIAMSAAVFSTFPPNAETVFDRTDFWRHCIFTGIAAEIMRSRLSRFANLDFGRETLHLCGLLHDIGKIIFEQYFHDPFVQALQLSQAEKIPLSEAEIRVMGIDHAQAGAWLGRKWNLSEPILEVIRWHHKPRNAGKAYRELVVLCHFSDLAVNMNRLGSSGNAFPKVDPAFEGEREHLESLIGLIGEDAASSSLLMSFLR